MSRGEAVAWVKEGRLASVLPSHGQLGLVFATEDDHGQSGCRLNAHERNSNPRARCSP